MTDDVFLAQFKEWIREMRLIANDRPGTGACALATPWIPKGPEPMSLSVTTAGWLPVSI